MKAEKIDEDPNVGRTRHGVLLPRCRGSHHGLVTKLQGWSENSVFGGKKPKLFLVMLGVAGCGQFRLRCTFRASLASPDAPYRLRAHVAGKSSLANFILELAGCEPCFRVGNHDRLDGKESKAAAAGSTQVTTVAQSAFLQHEDIKLFDVRGESHCSSGRNHRLVICIPFCAGFDITTVTNAAIATVVMSNVKQHLREADGKQFRVDDAIKQSASWRARFSRWHDPPHFAPICVFNLKPDDFKQDERGKWVVQSALVVRVVEFITAVSKDINRNAAVVLTHPDAIVGADGKTALIKVRSRYSWVRSPDAHL